METLFNQQQMREMFIPLLESRGKVFKKHLHILARQAEGGEVIETHTGDGLETVNTAKAGDMIVRNTTRAGEMYVMSAAKFTDRYERVGEGEEEGFAEYRPTGRILAIEMDAGLLEELSLPEAFSFTASWGSDMVVKAGDFLACPADRSSVYRIAREEFFETYLEEP
jgi:hypothetical protein